MKKSLFVRLSIILFIFSAVFGDDLSTLSLKNIRQIMHTIYVYHVENKEISPLLVQRSLKLYIQQFDPNYVYLLQEEVEPYLDLSISRKNEIINNYNKDRYPEYSSMNLMIKKAILRAQKIRNEKIKVLIDEGEAVLQKEGSCNHTQYPSTVEGLENRIYEMLILEIKKYFQVQKETTFNSSIMKNILNHRSKKNADFEGKYLSSSDHQLSFHILKAMARSLDAHTDYYTPQEAYAFRAILKQECLGIGVVLREDLNGVYISDLVHNGPAQRSGLIQIEDLLLAINGERIDRLSFEETLEVMKGQLGSKMTLSLKRGGEVLEVDLIREKITIDDQRVSFSYESYKNGMIGTIHVPSFYDNARNISVFKDLKEALFTLKSKGELKGIVIDFRENLGGFLTQAIKVSSLFINNGLVAVSRCADKEMCYPCDVNVQKSFEGPLVILISKASASAAEIVAQALQDYGVALVVGDKRSYGKGSMQHQTITNEKAQTFFKVTVGRYYTISGRSPQILGVQSDIYVPTVFSSYNIGERYLTFPLSNGHLSRGAFYALSYKNIISLAPSYLKPLNSKWRAMLPILVKK